MNFKPIIMDLHQVGISQQHSSGRQEKRKTTDTREGRGVFGCGSWRYYRTYICMNKNANRFGSFTVHTPSEAGQLVIDRERWCSRRKKQYTYCCTSVVIKKRGGSRVYVNAHTQIYNICESESGIYFLPSSIIVVDT